MDVFTKSTPCPKCLDEESMNSGNKPGLYIVDPDRKGAAPSKPKDAKDNESQKAYYARKYMETSLLILMRRCNLGSMKSLVRLLMLSSSCLQR